MNNENILRHKFWVECVDTISYKVGNKIYQKTKVNNILTDHLNLDL